MRFAGTCVILGLLAAKFAYAGFASFQTNGGSSATFTGFLDTYSSAGATWGFSAYKLTNAYSGNWGTVKRLSDSTTQTIGFLSTGKADVASFNTFCSGTQCVLNALVDQVNGINTSDASSSAAQQPRVIVDENSVLAVCPQPGSKHTTAFNSAVNTAKQHLFAVTRPSYYDNKHSIANLPTWVTTGNVASGNTTISSVASITGMSAANSINQGPVPSISDSADFLPGPLTTPGSAGAVYPSAVSAGSITIAKQPGNGSFPTGTQSGDTLTYTNAVLGGAWIMNGPSSASFGTTAYWGVGLASDAVAGDWTSPRNGDINGSSSVYQNVAGNGMRGQFGVWDFDTFTANLNYDSTSLGAVTGATSNVNITYSTNVGMTLFSDASGSEGVSNNCFETMVLFPATQASRVVMAQFFMTQDAISFPFAPNTVDGFSWTGVYQPNNTKAPNTVYGQATFTDINGIVWEPETGGYTWPSVSFANNINNSTTMWRFIDEQGDADTNLTSAERAEIGVFGNDVSPGHSFSYAYQFTPEAVPTQSGSWAYTGQIHYNGGSGGAAPDIVAISIQANQLQIITQKTVGGNPQTTNCGSPITLTVGTTYAVVGTGFWSTNGTSDTFQVNLGVNGTSLTLVCNTSGALWDQPPLIASAYFKSGIYRGFPYENAGTVIIRVMNQAWNPTTAAAFASRITSQPALPTHP